MSIYYCKVYLPFDQLNVDIVHGNGYNLYYWCLVKCFVQDCVITTIVHNETRQKTIAFIVYFFAIQFKLKFLESKKIL